MGFSLSVWFRAVERILRDIERRVLQTRGSFFFRDFGGGDRIHPGTACKSGRHRVKSVAQCVGHVRCWRWSYGNKMPSFPVQGSWSHLTSWRSTFFFLCVCVCARARVCVCVSEREREPRQRRTPRGRSGTGGCHPLRQTQPSCPRC